jgi:hypothetical protein
MLLLFGYLFCIFQFIFLTVQTAHFPRGAYDAATFFGTLTAFLIPGIIGAAMIIFGKVLERGLTPDQTLSFAGTTKAHKTVSRVMILIGFLLCTLQLILVWNGGIPEAGAYGGVGNTLGVYMSNILFYLGFFAPCILGSVLINTGRVLENSAVSGQAPRSLSFNTVWMYLLAPFSLILMVASVYNEYKRKNSVI